MGKEPTAISTDGEKTIYFKDVIGIQYKRNGMTLGYMQFETATGSMNNEKSNFFNENTFTFGADKDPIMEEVYEYVIGILDELKCGGSDKGIEENWEDEIPENCTTSLIRVAAA